MSELVLSKGGRRSRAAVTRGHPHHHQLRRSDRRCRRRGARRRRRKPRAPGGAYIPRKAPTRSISPLVRDALERQSGERHVSFERIEGLEASKRRRTPRAGSHRRGRGARSSAGLPRRRPRRQIRADLQRLAQRGDGQLGHVRSWASAPGFRGRARVVRHHLHRTSASPERVGEGLVDPTPRLIVPPTQPPRVRRVVRDASGGVSPSRLRCTDRLARVLDERRRWPSRSYAALDAIGASSRRHLRSACTESRASTLVRRAGPDRAPRRHHRPARHHSSAAPCAHPRRRRRPPFARISVEHAACRSAGPACLARARFTSDRRVHQPPDQRSLAGHARGRGRPSRSR